MKLQTIGKAFAATLFTVGAATISTATNGNMHWVGTAENDTTTTTVKTTTDSIPESSVIDEVIWVVGDEPILKSDVEVARMQMEMEGEKIDGDPDFRVPEQLAIQKLFLHQAELDSVQVTDAEVTNGVERQLNAWIQAVGSREKLEEYRGQSITAIREGLRTDYRNQLLIQEERKKIVGDIAVTPADVRRYFEKLPADSLPYVPTEVEVQILMQHPKIPQEEINRVKDRLREFTDRINKGETTFATLARLYSEDGSARQGGELGYMGRGILDPAFAQVAFNLTDPKKVSKIVESEFGFHIIQLIDKRGDKVNVRHILLKPRVPQTAIDTTLHTLDSIRTDIKRGKFTFDDACTYLSDDKNTRNNHGLMAFDDQENQQRTSRFQMKDLPTEVAREVEGLEVDSISEPFQMIDKNGKTACAIVKLKSRRNGHRADIKEDFQVMKNVVMNKMREDKIREWIQNKINHTYIWMADHYRNGDYEYKGWVKK